MGLAFIKEKPSEGSSIVVIGTITDIDGAAIQAGNINSIKWWLSDEDGNIINKRENVTLTPVVVAPAFVLSDEDLTLNDRRRNKVTLKVKVDFDSITYGNNLILIEEAQIEIRETVIRP